MIPILKFGLLLAPVLFIFIGIWIWIIRFLVKKSRSRWALAWWLPSTTIVLFLLFELFYVASNNGIARAAGAGPAAGVCIPCVLVGVAGLLLARIITAVAAISLGLATPRAEALSSRVAGPIVIVWLVCCVSVYFLWQLFCKLV